MGKASALTNRLSAESQTTIDFPFGFCGDEPWRPETQPAQLATGPEYSGGKEDSA